MNTRSAGIWLAGPLAALVLIATFEPVALTLEYDRAAVLRGEAWRLVTGHLTHFGTWHVAANMIGLLVLAVMFDRCRVPVRDWGCFAAVGACAVSLGLIVEPQALDTYRGLSALLYGLGVWLALRLAREGYALAWLVPLAATAVITFDIVTSRTGIPLPAGVSAHPLAHGYAVTTAVAWHGIAWSRQASARNNPVSPTAR